MNTPGELPFNDPPEPGHNRGPLPDVLVQFETTDLRLRAELLAEQARTAELTDDETEAKCVLLAGMIREHCQLIDKEREATKAPWLSACRAVDYHYHDLTGMLALYNTKRQVIGGPLHR